MALPLTLGISVTVLQSISTRYSFSFSLIELDKVPLDLESEPLLLPSLDIEFTCQVTSHLLR